MREILLQMGLVLALFSFLACLFGLGCYVVFGFLNVLNFYGSLRLKSFEYGSKACILGGAMLALLSLLPWYKIQFGVFGGYLVGVIVLVVGFIGAAAKNKF